MENAGKAQLVNLVGLGMAAPPASRTAEAVFTCVGVCNAACRKGGYKKKWIVTHVAVRQCDGWSPERRRSSVASYDKHVTGRHARRTTFGGRGGSGEPWL